MANRLFHCLGSTSAQHSSTLFISVSSDVKRDKEENDSVIGDYKEGLSIIVPDKDQDEGGKGRMRKNREGHREGSHGLKYCSSGRGRGFRVLV